MEREEKSEEHVQTTSSHAEENKAGQGEPSKSPSLLRNGMSLTGAIIAGFTLANMLSMLLAVVLGMRPNPYFGIFAYLLFPAIALFGLILMPIGMLRERRRRRGSLLPTALAASLDLTQKSVRRAMLGMVGFSLFFVTITAGASYHAYQFTESSSFCGLTCHEPMKPEFTAYQHSPHAQVECASCHVGSGATWFLRSKLSGTHQLWAVMRAEYPRPIQLPIKNLRPVRAACEQCHWPEKYYSSQFKTFTHFGSDEKNTPRQVQMLIKTGGGGAEFGKPTGIHWHMNIANRVEFVATDKLEQTIPWVKVKNGDGRTIEFFDKTSSLAPAQIAAMPKATMDCVTCHARPAHKFRPPVQAVDNALEAGKLDISLPFLKKQSVKVLTRTYASLEAAEEGIANEIDKYYRTKYPQIYKDKLPQIKATVATLQGIYQSNIFPFMHVDWKTYPDNIGHMYNPGCFRCHDGNHVSADGQVISNDCESCHTILGPPENPLIRASAKGSANHALKDGAKLAQSDDGTPFAMVRTTFKHPKELEKQNNCDSCHTGARL